MNCGKGTIAIRSCLVVQTKGPEKIPSQKLPKACFYYYYFCRLTTNICITKECLYRSYVEHDLFAWEVGTQ